MNWGVISCTFHSLASPTRTTASSHVRRSRGAKDYNSLYLMCVYGNKAQEARLRQDSRAKARSSTWARRAFTSNRPRLALGVIRDLIARNRWTRYIKVYRHPEK